MADCAPLQLAPNRVLILHAGLPHFPHVADQVGTGFESGVAGHPAGRRGFGALAGTYQLERLNLAHRLAFDVTIYSQLDAKCI